MYVLLFHVCFIYYVFIVYPYIYHFSISNDNTQCADVTTAFLTTPPTKWRNGEVSSAENTYNHDTSLYK